MRSATFGLAPTPFLVTTGLVLAELGKLPSPVVLRCRWGRLAPKSTLWPFFRVRLAQFPSLPRTRPPKREPNDADAIGLLVMPISGWMRGVLATDADGQTLSLSSPSVDRPASDLRSASLWTPSNCPDTALAVFSFSFPFSLSFLTFPLTPDAAEFWEPTVDSVLCKLRFAASGYQEEDGYASGCQGSIRPRSVRRLTYAATR